jgi:tetratricopeptide (TPR) repeat protein
MCGGDLLTVEGSNVATCDSCGTQQTLPAAADERRTNLFNRANHFRRVGEFDKALAAYESILNEDDSDAEAHWGALISRYGIEYVEDPRTREMIPTCHRVQFESVLSDADYISALENTPDSYTRSLYEKEAAVIAEIQKGILAISRDEEPYDVFICYKETTDGGTRTKDSAIAQDVYYQLTQSGYSVFFSRITLEDKLGRAYEPYIFSALNSAKVMLVIGTRPEHFNAVWVKNEWSRYLALMKKNMNLLLIPCYQDMDAYDLPDEMSMLQSQDMSKIGFLQDLLRGIDKILKKSKQIEDSISVIHTTGGDTVKSLLKRAMLEIEDKNYQRADSLLEQVLNIEPENLEAYIGKMSVEFKVSSHEFWVDAAVLLGTPLENYTNFKRALRFSDDSFSKILDNYRETVSNKIAVAQKGKQIAEKELEYVLIAV